VQAAVCLYILCRILFYNAVSTVVVRRLVNKELVLRQHLPRGAEIKPQNICYEILCVGQPRFEPRTCLARYRYTKMLRHIKVQHTALNPNKKARFSPVCKLLLSELAPLRALPFLLLTLNNAKSNFTQLTSQTRPIIYKPIYDSLYRLHQCLLFETFTNIMAYSELQE